VIRTEKRRILDEYQLLPTLARVIRGHALSERLDIRVLNLDRRPDRWQSFRDRVGSVVSPAFAARCERFPAIDGTALEMTPEITHLFRGNDFDFRRVGRQIGLHGKLLTVRRLLYSICGRRVAVTLLVTPPGCVVTISWLCATCG
jgi:hypothetical protein